MLIIKIIKCSPDAARLASFILNEGYVRIMGSISLSVCLSVFFLPLLRTISTVILYNTTANTVIQTL